MIDNSLNKHKALDDTKKKPVSKKEIIKFIKPYMMSEGKKKAFYTAMGLMVASKLLAVTSPYCLKIAVNALSTAETLDLSTGLWGIAGFGVARAFSVAFHEGR